MKVKEIEIDFSKMKNRVVLLVGGNATGKTSILSQLHPFALPGTMDVRSGSDTILDFHDGYKEIHIVNFDDFYVIKHHYQNSNGSIKMKSFISKNNKELNPNGNVTSFTELVNLELSIEQDYLTLLRLGSNVSNFMQMKSAQRKSFMTDLMSDIDVYTKYYRKINDDTRVMKTLLKTTADKLAKLRIVDEQEERNKVDVLISKTKKLYAENDMMQQKLGSIKSKIEESLINGMSLEDMKEKLSELTATFKTNERKLNNFPPVDEIADENTLRVLEQEIQQQLTSVDVAIATIGAKIDMVITQLDNHYQDKEAVQSKMRFHTSESEYQQTVEMYLNIHREYEKLAPIFEGASLKATRDEFLLALSVMQEIDLVRQEFHTFDNRAIREVQRLMDDGLSVETHIRFEVGKIDSKIEQTRRQQTNSSYKWVDNPNRVYVMAKEPGCNCSCPFEEFYYDITSQTGEDNVKSLASTIQVLENERDYYLSFKDIVKKVELLKILMKSNQQLFDKLPKDLIDTKKILRSFWLNHIIYDEELFTAYIEQVEKYDHFVSLKGRLRDVENDKLNMEKTRGSLDDVQSTIASIDAKIFNLEQEREGYDIEVSNLKEQRKAVEDDLESNRKAQKSVSDYKELKSAQAIVETERNLYKTKLEQLEDVEIDFTETKKDLATVQYQIDSTNAEIRTIEYKLKDFESLTKEQETLNEQFDDLNIIKESLSSNKGIPLLFIQLYLKNTRSKINELLDIVYNGELEINDFVINDKEFSIPYTKNGIGVKDVSKCSQGEESFVALALSFALIEQSIRDYNILLLDEIDATLDTNKRAMFISILEKQLDSIQAEQVFMITHNNMFDNYPVDLIMTSDIDVDNLKNTNVIFKA